MDAMALLDEVGIHSATIVGHSLRSFVAQWMAVLAPDRVRRLVLVGSAATSYNNTLVDLADAISALSDPVDVAYVREFQTNCVHRRVPEMVIDQAVRESMKLPARVWKSVIKSLVKPRFTMELEAIRCPMFVFWGDQDSVFNRADQDHLRRHIQGAVLYVFHDVGHTPHW
jgi:pimeloyl-ACP methyl ester carboxylesterase